ncbi:hypothetical protein FA95DRAFT_116713 [Auriscalpium vulgare]|uniref:Uncharacterized protein n=1 Tax=Auriscalpium vulgare TaxID=40419 RepID=A0ACB8RNS5_9AGAM|nr:hypothetical protein FA95DRAFT_116713 [Auriscalpium vulgare]
MPWTIPVFAHLTYLKVVNDYTFNHYPVDNLLDGLERMRELQTLDIMLNETSPQPAPDAQEHAATAQSRVVALNKMQFLALHGSPQTVMMLLSHLSLPAEAVAAYTFLAPFRGNDWDLDVMFRVALESVHWHANSTAPPHNAVTSVRIKKAWSLDSRFFEEIYDLIIIAHKDGQTADNESLILNMLGFGRLDTLGVFASAHLQELVLDNVLPVQWPDLPGLRRLTVTRKAADALSTIGVLPVLPSLAVLVLNDVRIAAGAQGAMWRLPQKIAKAGWRLQELDVAQCDVDGAWVAHAREALPGTRVKWDEGACERARMAEASNEAV